MITLMELINTTISGAADRVYSERAEDKAIFPYVVYKIPNSTDWELREDYILEVDVWDNKTDTTALDNLTDNIDAEMHRLNHLGNEFFVRFIRINRLQVPDSDASIRRRRLRYVIKAYNY